MHLIVSEKAQVRREEEAKREARNDKHGQMGNYESL